MSLDMFMLTRESLVNFRLSTFKFGLPATFPTFVHLIAIENSFLLMLLSVE